MDIAIIGIIFGLGAIVGSILLMTPDMECLYQHQVLVLCLVVCCICCCFPA